VMLPASRWMDALNAAGLDVGRPQPDQNVAARPGAAMPSDEAYERGLRVALQVIVPD